MKKVHILICVIIMILLVGCCEKTESNEKTDSNVSTNKFDKLKSELLLIPKVYNIDNADKDGSFVIRNEEAKSRSEIIDKFISDSQNQKPTSITIVQYTAEGKQIISKIVYDGIKYYGIEDDSRVTDNNKEYHEFEFKYLKVFKENNRKTYVLFNVKEINYTQFIRSLTSSNSKDFIDHQFLCSYNNLQY